MIALECEMCGELGLHHGDCPFGPRLYRGAGRLVGTILCVDRQRQLDFLDRGVANSRLEISAGWGRVLLKQGLPSGKHR